VVSAWRTDAQVSDLRELADDEAGSHDSTAHPLSGGGRLARPDLTLPWGEAER
jgi:hypothetical protein